MLLKSSLCVLAILALSACTGVSTVKLITNGPADVAVDGIFMGPAPVTFPVPWRNTNGGINFAQRKVSVSTDGNVIWEKYIGNMLYQKQQNGDYDSGSKYGAGRTYTIIVEVRPATQPTTQP